MYLYISGKYSGNCVQHYLLKYLKCINILPNKTNFKRGFMPSKEKLKLFIGLQNSYQCVEIALHETDGRDSIYFISLRIYGTTNIPSMSLKPQLSL